MTGLLKDVALVFVAPRRLFDRLMVRNRIWPALALLVVLQTIAAALILNTGVIDYEIDLTMERSISTALRQQTDDQEINPAIPIEAAVNQARFSKIAARIHGFLEPPLRLVVTVLFVSSVCFVAGAMRGAKPNFELLEGVVTFSSYVQLPRLLLQLFLIAQLHVTRVELSAAAFASDPGVGLIGYLLLRRLDPFDFWFWSLVGLGMVRTRQLPCRWVLIIIPALALMAATFQCVTDVLIIGDLGALAQVPE